MKKLVVLIALVFIPQTSTFAVDKSSPKPDADLVIEGTVLQMSPPTPASGVIAFYRLVKYRVDHVCKGRYSGSEIIVDHWIVTTKELDGVKVGDKVCFAVNKSKTIGRRVSFAGIRSPSEVVKIFYLGNAV